MKKTIIMSMLFCVLFVQFLHAEGLDSRTAHIQIDNMTVGKPYIFSKEGQKLLDIRNIGDEELTVKTIVIRPAKKDLIGGFEAIPNTKWVKLEKDSYTIPAKGKINLDVSIEIPDKEEYKGKAYQAVIWSHTASGGAVYGTRTKLFVTTMK